MTLLLFRMRYRSPDKDRRVRSETSVVNLAMDLKKIASVSRISAVKKEQSDLLLSTVHENKFAIKLKNGRLLPVDVIEKTIEYGPVFLRMDDLLRGCLAIPILKGYAMVEDIIYGIPDDIFLEGKSEQFRR